MKKTNLLKLLLHPVALSLLVFTISCDKEEAKVSEIGFSNDPILNSLYEYPEQYEELGIKTIDKDIPNPIEISNEIKAIEHQEQFNFAVADYKYSGFNSKSAYLFASSANANNFYVIPDGEISNVLYVEVQDNQIAVKLLANEVKFMFELSEESKIVKINNESTLELRADCDELGPRRRGEDFGDCFSRNWGNFCCDFVGCAAQITNPYAVAAAVAISCGGAVE